MRCQNCNCDINNCNDCSLGYHCLPRNEFLSNTITKERDQVLNINTPYWRIRISEIENRIVIELNGLYDNRRRIKSYQQSCFLLEGVDPA